MNEKEKVEPFKIYSAIAGVMKDIGVVSKDKEFKSNFGSYKFRGIDDVMNALHPAMVANKVFVTPVILEQIREERTTSKGGKMYFVNCKIRYDFYTDDGSHVSAIVIGEGLDTGDKATNKAMSIAFKYACFQVFCIPTDEMADPDGERPEQETNNDKKTPNQRTTKPKAQSNKTPEEVVDIEKIKEELKRTGVTEKTLFESMKIKSWEDMTPALYKRTIAKFQKTPDKRIKTSSEVSAETVISDKDVQLVKILIEKHADRGTSEAKILKRYNLKSLEDMTPEQYMDFNKKIQLYKEEK